jgi:hypothetical protein
MNLQRKIKFVQLFFVLSLVALLLFGGAALAKTGIPSTEPDGDAPEAIPPSFDSASPSEALPPDENQPSSVNSPALTFSYYQVAGATLRGRNSSTEYLYDGLGCSYVTVGTGIGRILNTELPLPDGSVIKYLRVYYRDTNATSGVRGYITRYQPGVATADLINVGSSAAYAGGYGFVVSGEITETVNNTPYAYTLIGWPDVIGSANQICGLRVAYYAPIHAHVFLPALSR